MPLVIPWGPCGRFRADFRTVSAIHNEDLVRVVVRFLPKVDVIKLGRVLITKKQACVAVAVIGVRRHDIDIELEGFQLEIIDERDVVGTSMRRFVGAGFRVLTVNMTAICGLDLPRIFLGRPPTSRTIFKICFIDDGPLLGSNGFQLNGWHREKGE